MFKNILHLYALLVCLIATIILIITLSLSLNVITNLTIPQYKYASSLHKYQSNEAYLQYYKEDRKQYDEDKKVTVLKNLSFDQLDKKREFEKNQFLEEKKADNIGELISTLQWVFVVAIFFFIHWRLYKKSKQ